MSTESSSAPTGAETTNKEQDVAAEVTEVVVAEREATDTASEPREARRGSR